MKLRAEFEPQTRNDSLSLVPPLAGFVFSLRRFIPAVDALASSLLHLSFGRVIAVPADGALQAGYFMLHELFTDEASVRDCGFC